MKLTLGMAVYDDYHGAIFTSQSLALYHALYDWEIVIVDNNPKSAHGRETAGFARSVAGRKDGVVRYIPMPEGGGTSQPRNRVFQEARGEIVACMDSHILLAPSSLEKLVGWFDEHPDSLDLMQGPLVYDDLGNVSTHFDETWREEMEGTWQTDPRGLNPDGEPFDIPAQGLGFFACRKAAWLGFNPHFRAFGGEECYIHRKFRKAGRRTLCHPALRWWHRFGRPEGVRYTLSRYRKVRNYVLGRLELELPLDPVYEHFVASGRMPQAHWDYLLADPVFHETEPTQQKAKAKGCGGGCGGGRLMPTEGAHLDQIFDWAASTPRDLDKHLPKIRELAAKCDHVTEFSKRRESTVGLLAGYPSTVISYNLEDDPLHKVLHETVERQGGRRSTRAGEGDRQIKTFTQTIGAHALSVPEIEETDLLFIDSVHSAERLWTELEKHGERVKRYLVLRGTGAFGEKAEGADAPGLLYAIRRWMKEHPEWSVVHHSTEEYGLTVLSRDDRDKPKLPGKIQMAANFAKAVKDHVADGLQKVEPAQLEARLEICTMCDQRKDDRCAACGCFLSAKAAMRSSFCPLGKWEQVEEPKQSEAA